MTEPTDAEIDALWRELFSRHEHSRAALVRAASAKWGQPAQAAEPFGYVNTYTGQFYKDVEPCSKNNEGHWRTVFTSQQPTQTQPVAREPLTEEQVFAAIRGINSLDALAVWRSAETAHGIKGGQHGTE